MSRLRLKTRIKENNLKKAQEEGHITLDQAEEVKRTEGRYNPYTDTYLNTDVLPEITVTAKAPKRTWTSEWSYNDPDFRLRQEHINIGANNVAKSTRDKMNQVAPYAALIQITGAIAPLAASLGPYLAPGTAGGNFIGNLAKDMLIYEGFNRGTKIITGTTIGELVRRGLDKVSNGYIPASAKAAGPIGEIAYDLFTEAPTFTFGSKVVAPMIKRGVDSAYEMLPVAYSKLKNTSRSAQIAYTLNNGIRRATKNGHIEVPKTYFSNPQKAYRRTVGPTEIEDVKTIGYFRDAHESTTVPKEMLRSHGVSGWTRGYPYWSFNKKYDTFLTNPKKIHSFFEVDGTGKSFNVGASGNYSLDLIPFENIAIRSAKDAELGTATGAFGIKPGDKTILAQDANLFTINPSTKLYIYQGKIIPYKIRTYLIPTEVLSTIDPNGKIRIQLRTHTKTKPREFVLDPAGNNQYRFHQRIWDDVDKKIPGTLTLQEKDLLFQSVLDELPEGATILPTQSTSDYLATVGTVKGRKILNRMAEADGRFVLGEPLPFLYLENGIVKEWSTPSITKLSPTTRFSISRAEYSKGTTDPVKLAEIKLEFLKNNPGLTIIDNGVTEQIRIPEDLKLLTTNMISRIKNFGRDLDKSGVKYYDPKTELYITTSYRDYVNNVIPDYIQLELPKDSYTAGLNGYFTRLLGGNTSATLVTNPFNSDIYSTIFHEGSMHPTEDAIMRIPIPNHPQGKTIGDLYQSVAYPSDIIDSKILDSLIKNADSTLDVEARATNGEVFRKINLAIAKATGKPISEISKDRELFEKLVDKNWGTLEKEEDLVKLGNLLRTTPGGYVDDYYRILTSDKIPFETRQRYAKRILYMIKKLPIFAAPVTITAKTVSQEKRGGKLYKLIKKQI